MATVYTKYLRQTTYTGFTTTGTTLTFAQMDSTLIGLKQDIDALVLTVAAIPSHTQETDRYLKYNTDYEYDSYHNFRGSFDGKFGDDAENTVKFNAEDTNYFTELTDFEIEVYGLKEDVNGVTQPIEVGYKDKGLNGFIAMPTEDCHIVWKIHGNLRNKAGI